MTKRLFDWETLQTIVGGQSALDLPVLTMRSPSEAADFLVRYGFDPADPSQAGELESLRRRALEFLERDLLPESPGLAVPPEHRNERSVCRLLLWASDLNDTEGQRWACAILRVMHAMAHAHSALNDWFGPEIRAQILDRFEPVVHPQGEGLWFGEGEDAVALHSFELKHRKPMASVVMKLLHKPENVAADVFDRVGVRIVTKRRFDVLMVVRWLRLKNIISFPNVKPSRSRNTLIDMDWLERALEDADEAVRAGKLRPEARADYLRQRCEGSPYPAPGTRNNRFSSRMYRSVQFTGRQLVRIPGERAGHPGEDLRFFFPYEVQVMDQQAFEAARSGRAAHDEYKARQRRAVLRRILGVIGREA